MSDALGPRPCPFCVIGVQQPLSSPKELGVLWACDKCGSVANAKAMQRAVNIRARHNAAYLTVERIRQVVDEYRVPEWVE